MDDGRKRKAPLSAIRPATLEPLSKIATPTDVRLLIAARLGRARLIDNISTEEQ